MTASRSTIPLIAGLALVAACSSEARETSWRADSLLLDRTERMRVERERADAPVEVGMTMIAISSRDAGPLPSVRMAPPAEVEFELPTLPEGAVLHFAAGLGTGSHGAERRTVQLTAELDGAELFRERLVAHAEVPIGERTWRRATIPVGGGGRLVLRTDVRPARAGDAPIPAAFGLLELRLPVPIARTSAAPDRPSVLLVLVDTLRADALGAYGETRDLTPRLDELAEEGAVFERCYAPSSWTLPSTASLFTVLPPPAHGVESDASAFLSSGLDTLAERFSDAGLRTAAFCTNELITAERNFAQGFEEFHDRHLAKTHELLPEVEAWLATHAGERFFLYLHLYDPHMPLTPAPEHRARWAGEPPDGWTPDATWRAALARMKGEPHDPERLRAFAAYDRALYDAEVAGLDAALGKLFDRLRALGLDETTVVCVTSDHGEEFFEHDMTQHTKQLFEESLRVPLLVAGPGVEAGRRVAAPVSLTDVGATLLALAGLGGPSLLEEVPERPLYAATELGWWFDREDGLRMRDASLYAVLDGDERLHWAVGHGPEPLDLLRLYDLGADPAESEDRSATYPDRAAELRTALEAWLAEQRERAPRTFGADEEAREILRRLGYVGGGE